MSQKLSRYEAETHIGFNEEEQTAYIDTHNKSLMRQLSKLLDERPDDITCTRHEPDVYMSCVIPKKWIKIRPNRILSEEEKAKKAEHMRNVRQNQKSD